MRWVYSAAVLFLLTVSAAAGELEERERITVSARALFQQEDFEALTRIVRDYRSNSSRTSSGVWLLTLFHNAVGRADQRDTREKKYWEELDGKARRWTERFPEEPAGYIARARLAVDRGWAIRGRKRARSVSPEDWAPFRESVEAARRMLMQHRQIANADPHWYAVMIEIAMLQGWDEAPLAELIQEGFSRFPDYYAMHFAIARLLEPKWGGNGEAIEAFANAAVEWTRETDGTGMYARIYWYVSSDEYGDDLFSRSKVEWPRMRSGIEDVLNRYPNQWNINNFARFSCLAGDMELAKHLIDRIEGDPIRDVWTRPWEFKKCEEQAAAETPPPNQLKTEAPAFVCPKEALEEHVQRPIAQRSSSTGAAPIFSDRFCVVSNEGRKVRHGPYMALGVDGQWLQLGQYEAGARGRGKVGEWRHRRPGTCGDWIEWSESYFRNAEEQRANAKPTPRNLAMNSEDARCPDGLRGRGRVTGAVGSKVCTRDGLPEGPAWIWYESGVTQFEKHYATGILDGPFRAYHSNGALRWEGAFEGGLEEGRWRQFDCSGQLVCEGKAKAGHIVNGWECSDGTAPSLHGWIDDVGRQ